MRHSPIPETSHDERLKERIRPLLSPCDGLSEPAMGQARLMRIVDRIRSAVTSMDIADRYGFSALWIKIGNCLRDESVAAGRSERFSLFMVALESALERLNASLFEFRGDTVIGLVSGLQGTRFARAIGELRFRHSDTPAHVASLDRYVALRERYDQCRDLLPRISELSLSSDPAMGHRALIVTDTGIIVAEKLDRACDDAALLDIFREM